MKEDLIVYASEDDGFNRLLDIYGCTVGIIKGCDMITINNQKKTEKHNDTDEIFIPVKGNSGLFIGEGENKRYVELYPGKAYCVKKGIWHSFVTDTDGIVFVVEKKGTGEKNSEYRFKE